MDPKKMEFIRLLWTARADNKSKKKILNLFINLFRERFPDVSEKTAKNSITWELMDLRRKGKFPRYKDGKVKSSSNKRNRVSRF